MPEARKAKILDRTDPLTVLDGRECCIAGNEELLKALQPPALINQRYDPTDPETPDKYKYKPETEPTPDPTPFPGVTPAPTPKWTVHPTLKAWGYC